MCSLDMNGVFAKVCMLFKGHDDLLQVRLLPHLISPIQASLMLHILRSAWYDN